LCHCGHETSFEECCGAIISGKRIAITAEDLMRSRYSAYTQANSEYIAASQRGAAAKNFDVESSRAWASQCEWLGLEIIDTKRGKANDDVGWVEFIARMRSSEGESKIHERSKFKKLRGKWYYVSGHLT